MPTRKLPFPVDRIRRFLEPGPVVLVTSRHDGETDVMTMGWHLVMEFVPSLVGCVIARSNRTADLVRASRQCVINLPTASMVDVVSRIGNCSGRDVDKLAAFGLTGRPATKVGAPLIDECHANFECVLHDDRLVDDLDFYVFEVVAAQVARSPKRPETVHYRGDAEFMVSGKTITRRRLFTTVS
jgi:flavin reductase (DIM6/NTAB) family NADH-FMN oxidoreductase RutF